MWYKHPYLLVVVVLFALASATTWPGGF